MGLTVTGQAQAATARIPLITFYSPSRGDYFTTTQSSWSCKYFHTCSGPLDLDYSVVGIQGHVFNPDNPRPAGTVPLYHWWSAVRADNFLTSNPDWAGVVGDTRWEGGANYVLFRVEGYISTAPATVSPMPLSSYWNPRSLSGNSPSVGDNAATATWRGGIPAGYGYYRTEGYLLGPESSSLDRCLANTTPNHQDSPSWQARGNYIDTWSAPPGFLNGDTIRLTAPSDRYRIDFWGHEYPVRGYSWSHATSDFPLPGEPPYALVARVTSGRAYVAGRGWYEANSWFKGLGDSFDSPGMCILYDMTGAAPGQLQTSFNDPNISDNGGWANVAVQQWW